MHVLQQNPDIAIDDLKARAAMHGFGINAASVAAARQLLAPNPAPSPARAATLPAAAVTAPTAVAPVPPTARTAQPAGAVDAVSLVRTIVDNLQHDSTVEARRLKDAIRQAIAVLDAAIG